MFDKLRHKIYNLLRWSEKYTKTDMVYLVKSGGWLALGRSVSILSGLALAIGFANLLPKEVYGNYKFALSLAGIIGAFSLTGMRTAMIRSVSRGFEGALSEGVKIHLRWGIVVVVISFAGSLYYFLNENNTLTISLLIIGSFSPFLASASLYGAFIEGKKDFKTSAFYSMLRNTLPATLLVSTIFITRNPVLILLVYFASNMTVVGFLYFKTIKKYKPNQKIDSQTTSYSKHLSIMNILGAAALHIDKVLVFHYLGAAQLAIYAFAIVIPEQIKGFGKILAVLTLPKFSTKDFAYLKNSLPSKAFKFSLVVIFIVLIYIVLAPHIYKILFPQYLESVLFSQIFALTLLFMPTVLYYQAFVSQMMKKELYILKFATPIVQIMLLFILLPLYGILGAIVAIIAAHITHLFLLMFLFKRSG